MEKTAAWLRDGGAAKKKSSSKAKPKAKQIRYDDSPLDRRTLLSVAEVKVEYRLSKSTGKPRSGPRSGKAP